MPTYEYSHMLARKDKCGYRVKNLHEALIGSLSIERWIVLFQIPWMWGGKYSTMYIPSQPDPANSEENRENYQVKLLYSQAVHKSLNSNTKYFE
jgi:hypothetical protein